MSEQTLVDVTGRPRSAAATPGHWAGCAPPNKGLRFPADPPTVEEIILVMRQAGPGRYADRTRGLIAILWRAGLRISEALALTESDLDPKPGSVLVRSGKGGKRRVVGMDDWAWEHVVRWTEHRVQLLIGPLFCILAGPTRGRGWSATAARGELRRLAAEAGGPASVRAVPAPTRARDRDGSRRDPAADYSKAARACTSRDHLDLSPGDRHARDRRHRAPPPATGDPGQRWSTARADPEAGRRAAHPRPATLRSDLIAAASGHDSPRPPHDPPCPIRAARSSPGLLLL